MRIACLAAATLLAAWPASAETFDVLHRFCVDAVCSDGKAPLESPLLADGAGNYLGVAQNGGTAQAGVLFELVGGTKYKKLFDFPAVGSPRGPLIQDVDGNLYGIESNGAVGAGGIFRLHPTNARRSKWSFKTIYTFCTGGGGQCLDGSTPVTLTYEGAASGVPYDGSAPLYGSTVFGGTNDSGVVFALVKKRGLWRQTVLHTFCAAENCPDGQWPTYALLSAANGVLYGATTAGGDTQQGTIFKLTPNARRSKWTTSVAYSFCPQTGCADGAQPAGLAVDGDGNLFGTTTGGGDAGWGTLFRLSPQGGYTRLHSFCRDADCTDGAGPLAAPILGADGTLYGVTSLVSRLWSFVPGTATYSVLHSFCTDKKCSDGFEPLSPLTLDAGGTLYGSTAFGGNKHSGGTVFSFNP